MSFVFVNTLKMYPIKAKHSEKKDYTLCLGNFSKDFTIDNLKITELKASVTFFADFNPSDTNDVLDIRK